MAGDIANWRDLIGSQSLDAYLAERFGDRSRFRISRRIYPPSVSTAGTMIGGLCFVVGGRCRFTFEVGRFDLQEGEYCQLPAGAYSLVSRGEVDCMVFKVFEIPGTKV